MGSFNMCAWKDTISTHLQTLRFRKRTHVIMKIIVNLEAVNCGLKPGFLWDIKEAPMQSSQLVNLLTDLKKRDLIKSDMLVAKIAEECIVTDLRWVSSRCLNLLDCFVNVSQHLPLPVAAKQEMKSTNEILSLLKSMHQRMVEFLEEASKTQYDNELTKGQSSQIKNTSETSVEAFSRERSNRNIEVSDSRTRENFNHRQPKICLSKEMITPVSKNIDHSAQDSEMTDYAYFVLKLEENWCIPSILGVFIGYPVVYWYNNSGSNNGDTCLSHVPLTVYKIYVEVRPENMSGVSWFELYSFSIPCCVLEIFECRVLTWFQSLSDVVKTKSRFIKKLKLEKEVVTLTSVVM